MRLVNWLTVHWCHYGEAAIDFECSPCCDRVDMWWDRLADWLTVHCCHYGEAVIDFQCSPCCDNVCMWWDRLADWLSIDVITARLLLTLSVHHVVMGLVCGETVSWLTVHWCHYGEAAIDFECSPCCDRVDMWWDRLADWLSIDVITARQSLTSSVHHAVIMSVCGETG